MTPSSTVDELSATFALGFTSCRRSSAFTPFSRLPSPPVVHPCSGAICLLACGSCWSLSCSGRFSPISPRRRSLSLARRLVGKRSACNAGWVSLSALSTTIPAVAVGGAPYVAQLFGVQIRQVGEVAIAVAMIAATTALNVSGTSFWLGSRCSGSFANCWVRSW